LTPIALSAERIGRQLDRLTAAGTARDRVMNVPPPSPSRGIGKNIGGRVLPVRAFLRRSRIRSDLNEVVSEALAVFHGRLMDLDPHELAPNRRR
jgi:hypothetical protein